ncbi:hypothetical protein, partial [Acinetobacter baumannii]|uniref:hypothetical protein n=1 Tax=Acinetobacter baumannii TaxID=470 RepID=UPI001C08100C
MLCDAHTAPARCRGDDTVVVLARGDEERVARSGSRQAELTYRDPLDPLPLAALVAGVAQERTPVVLDVASQAVLA